MKIVLPLPQDDPLTIYSKYFFTKGNKQVLQKNLENVNMSIFTLNFFVDNAHK